MYKGLPIYLLGDFSAEILKARREWDDIVTVPKEKTGNQDYYIQQKYSLKIEGEMEKIFRFKKKW